MSEDGGHSSQSLGADSEMDHLDRYNPGSAGDVARTIRTKQRNVVYGDTPPEARKYQFEKMAHRSGSDLKTFAKRIIGMSWNEKLELIEQEYSSDKQVVKLLEKAAVDQRDQERETGVRQLSYNNLSLPHIHGKKKQPSDKQTRSDLIGRKFDLPAQRRHKSDLSRDDDEDNHLSGSFDRNEHITRKNGTFEENKERDKCMPRICVESDQFTVAKSPKPEIVYSQRVKPAPPGQFYRKRTACDDEKSCDNRKNISDSTNSSRSKKMESRIEEELNIDKIFSSDNETKSLNVSTEKPNIHSSDKRVSFNSCTNISLDDIFD